MSGPLVDVDRILSIKTHELSPLEKIVGLKIDAVYLKSDINYDSNEDMIVGPHTNANVVLLRGIFSPYKIPIWYKFQRESESSQITQGELYSIVAKLKEAGYYVVISLTSDMGGGNQGFAKKLGVSHSKPYFEGLNAMAGEQIWYVWDNCHLLKRLRDAFVDHGFFLAGGTFVDKSMIERLLKV